MRQEKKVAYLESELERYKLENRQQQAEIRVLEKERTSLQSELDEAKRQYEKLRQAFDKHLFEDSERIEQTEEARLAYEAAERELREALKEYKTEALQWIEAIKQTGKAV